LDESVNAKFNPKLSETMSNFCAVSWLGPPPVEKRDWVREVSIVLEELKDKPNLITAIKSILKNKEAREHLSSIELNSIQIHKLIDLKSDEPELFENNPIQHIHFK
jgi:hypothetical protein